MTAPAPFRVAWRKSSYSGNSGDCVEVTAANRIIAVRDSKDPHGPHLHLTPGGWQAFISALKPAASLD